MRKILSQLLLALATVLIFGSAINAQICNGTQGNNIVNNTFGAGGNPGPALPAGTTNYIYNPVAGNPPAVVFDGQYCLVNQVPNNPSWWTGALDRTPNDINGYMVFFNAAPNPGIFYTQTVNNLCAGTPYQFSAWVLNACRAAANLAMPNLTFTISDANTMAVLATNTTGNIPAQNAPTWVPVGITFTMPAGVNAVVLTISNANQGGNGNVGNDLAIDDISFSPCGPTTTAGFGTAQQQTLSVCTGQGFNLFGTVGPGLLNPAYQWEFSSDNGGTWNNVPGATILNFNHPGLGNGTYLFHLLSAEATNINAPNCRFVSNNITLTVASCCSDTCYWKVTGNNIINGNNLFGTLTNDGINIISSNSQRGAITAGGFFGWATTNPSTRFHVNCAPSFDLAPSMLRFEALTLGSGSPLLVDANGYVFRGKTLGGGGVTNNCGNLNFVTKTGNPGFLECSQIYDDGAFVGIATTNPFFVNGTQATLNVNGLTVSNSFYSPSDRRYKENIKPIENATSIIEKLRGVTYTWNREAYPDRRFEDGLQAGFIAQEVREIYPLAVVGEERDNGYLVNYSAFIPLLAQGQRELNQRIDQLTATKAAMEKEISSLKNQVNELLARNKQPVDVPTNGNSMSQNRPNPFNNSTTIDYTLVSMKSSAFIMIYDLTGKEQLRFRLPANGKSSVQVTMGSLPSGMYLYTLVIDGVEIDTKKMILSGD